MKERFRLRKLRAAKQPPLNLSNSSNVVSKLAESVGLKVVRPTCPHAHCSALSDETKRLVYEFYQSSDISWQAPGRKDRVIIRESTEWGEKV